MILNHKNAIKYIIDNTSIVQGLLIPTINISNIPTPIQNFLAALITIYL